MDRRVPADAGAVDHHRPGPDEPNRGQRRALQPHPCRDFLFAGTLGAARFGKPQRHAGRQRRHPRRLHAAAGRYHSHRPFANGVRARSGGGVSRFVRRRVAKVLAIATIRVLAASVDESDVLSARRADEDYASPRPNSISRARSRRGGSYSQSGPRRGATLPAGVRDGQSARS